LNTFAPAFGAKRLIEGLRRDRIPAWSRKESEVEIAGKFISDFLIRR
jgi:hypothetical protein